MVKFIREITLGTSMFVLLPNSAAAFNFGFVRVPDYLDPFFIALLIAALPSWICVVLTKPKHVPLNELTNTKLEPVPRAYFRILQLIIIAFLSLLFVGMGLARYAEATSG
ncbi:hypothetical protein GP644_18540 [Parasedimentitalea maritima]|uniref:Uncharacterized protein n=2 Tax=Parasedimentitalea maritima TaxID=2578117 RepID=A0A6A4R865_9RHOB|nr:hypothetical protein GP644_18540 [Zongyanglinia marina]